MGSQGAGVQMASPRCCQIRRSIVHSRSLLALIAPSHAALAVFCSLFITALLCTPCTVYALHPLLFFFPFFVQPLFCSGSLSFQPLSFPFFSSAPRNEIKKKAFFFQHQSGQHNYTNQQTRLSLACPSVWPRTPPNSPSDFSNSEKWDAGEQTPRSPPRLYTIPLRTSVSIALFLSCVLCVFCFFALRHKLTG